MSGVALLGLIFVAGISVTARSEDATIGGRSVSDWVAALKSNDSSIWREAFVALRLFGPTARGAVPALIEALDDPRQVVQLEAADTLREIGPEAVAAAPVLVHKLGIRESRTGIAYRSSRALIAIGPTALPSLIQCLEGDNDDARRWAVPILAGFGPAAKDAVPALARLVDHQDSDQAQSA